MEVFADAHREALLDEAETRRRLKATRQAGEADRVTREPPRGTIGRTLAWLVRLARPGRRAAAS